MAYFYIESHFFVSTSKPLPERERKKEKIGGFSSKVNPVLGLPARNPYIYSGFRRGRSTTKAFLKITDI